MKYITITLLCLAALPFSVNARPVSWAGGWTAMQKNNHDNNSIHIHYSPTAFYSVGYKGEQMRGNEYQIHSLQLNRLLKRWNKPHSQANLYFKGSAGIAEDDGNTEAAYSGGLAFDWETRRYFTSYENRFLNAGDIEKSSMHKGRVGIAPYVAEAGRLHTWLMLEVMQHPSNEDDTVVTPLVRLFKGPYLAEAGVTTRGNAMFNWIVRF